MRKVYLSVIGFSLLCRLNAHAQTRQDTSLHNKSAFTLYAPVSSTDTTGYNPRALRVDEVNFVTSYYSQTGDHSAVIA